MASTLSTPITTLQVGTCFMGKYYHVLQQQLDFVHQFYTDLSVVHCLDRDKQGMATRMRDLATRDWILEDHFGQTDIAVDIKS